MGDDQNLQSEIDIVSGEDDNMTNERGGNSEDGGSSGDSGSAGESVDYTLSVYANPVAGASSVTVEKTNEGRSSQSIKLEAKGEYTLTAVAAKNYIFSGWYLDNSLQSTSSQYEYTAPSTVTQNISFEARFTLNSGGGSGTSTPAEVTELFSTPNAEYDVDITINYPLLNPISDVSVKLNRETIPVTFTTKTTESSIQTIHVIYHYTQPSVIPHEGGLEFEILFTQNNVQYHKYYGIGSPSVAWEHPVNSQSDY